MTRQEHRIPNSTGGHPRPAFGSPHFTRVRGLGSAVAFVCFVIAAIMV